MSSDSCFDENAIIPLAKFRGETSYAALACVKKALRRSRRTESSGAQTAASAKKKAGKVGHTGTLDSFADGLLVVLTGKMTRFASCITALPKRYRALVRFGMQTDTLDPTGLPVRRTALPAAAALSAVLPRFTGTIFQTPPEYSALKQGGKRLSDLAREGETVVPEAREISVYALRAETYVSPDGSAAPPSDFPAGSPVAAAVLDVSCSKGTYVRALARDIALSAGSSAFLLALRRLSVGPFSLESAAGFSALPSFWDFAVPELSGEPPLAFDRPLPASAVPGQPDVRTPDAVFSAALSFTPDLARSCGLETRALRCDRLADFCAGKPLRAAWFLPPEAGTQPAAHTKTRAQTEAVQDAAKQAVFCGDSFVGLVSCSGGRLSYEFVAGENHARV